MVSGFSIRLLFNMIAIFFLPLQWPFWKCIVVFHCWSIRGSVSYLVLFKSCWTAQVFAFLPLHAALFFYSVFQCLAIWTFFLPCLTIIVFNLFSLVSLVSIEFFIVPISLDRIQHWCHTLSLWKVLFVFTFLPDILLVHFSFLMVFNVFFLWSKV